MVDEIAKMTARFCVKLVKPTIKVLLWTYLWILLAGVALANMTAKESVWLYNSIVALSAFLWLWFFVQRFVRMFLKDPGFSFLALILDKTGVRKEHRELNPKAEKSLLTLIPEDGYPVGKQGRQWVVLPDEGKWSQFHVLVLGGSGSGKTSTQVIPLILKSQLPAFIVDIKGELREKTAQILSRRGRKIKVFNPSDPTAYGYDPFGTVRKEMCVQDMTIIANALVPLPPGTNEDQAFWVREAQSYLAGALLFCFENGTTFTEAMRTIQATPAEKFVEAAMKNGSDDVQVLLGHYASMAPETLGSVFAQLASRTMIFASDVDIQRCFNTDRVICPEDLLEGTTIFFQAEESKLNIYRDVVQLILQQFLSYMERADEAPQPRVNFILDEFFRLGKLSSVENAMATLRSKGIRIFAVTQSLGQISQLYGKEGMQSLVDNFNVSVILGATSPESQRFFSEKIGTYYKNVQSKSSNHQTLKIGGSVGTSSSEQERKLVKPEEFARLGDECILFACGGWSRVKKMPYYAAKEFQE